MKQRAYRAICFDLDGTLLPMDLDDFMKSYFKSLGAFMAGVGVNPEYFMNAMKAGIGAMASHPVGTTNREVFWEAFEKVASIDPALDLETLVADFYNNEFGKLCQTNMINPPAIRAIKTLKERGYPLILLTMPMFPIRAVEWRLEWAGVDSGVFERITSYENSTSIKPKLNYYAENLVAANLRGEDVLMVGNNTEEDLSFMALGADAFLVTDNLIDPIGYDMDSVRHGSMEDFANWVETLPDCDDPATGIDDGLIAPERTERALRDNIVDGVDLAAADSANFKLNGM